MPILIELVFLFADDDCSLCEFGDVISLSSGGLLFKEYIIAWFLKIPDVSLFRWRTVSGNFFEISVIVRVEFF